MKQKIYLGLSIITSLFIWYNSSIIGETSSAISTTVASGLLGACYRFLSLLPFTFEQFHAFIRKLGHVSEYAFLAFLLVQALKQRVKPSLILASCLFVAVVDEWIQTQTRGRNGTLSDVILDVLAAMVMIAFLFFMSQHKKKTRIKSNL